METIKEIIKQDDLCPTGLGLQSSSVAGVDRLGPDVAVHLTITLHVSQLQALFSEIGEVPCCFM